MATVVEYCESVQAGCNAHAPPQNEAIRSKICFFVRGRGENVSHHVSLINGYVSIQKRLAV